ncbi:MAG: M23 family metallopeptidase [Gemmatimonadota bacterium]|nr:M23 family metallopeptidase [Gemmatimonadota bacterium]
MPRTVRLLSVAIAAGVLGVAAVLTLRNAWPWERPGEHAVSVAALLEERSDTLRRGETVSDLFARNGAPGFVLSAQSPPGLFDPRRLRPGLVFTFLTRSDDSVPNRVVFRDAPERRVALEPLADGWAATAETVRWSATPMVLHGTMTSSLYVALDAGIPDSVFGAGDRVRLAWDLADVFAWQVDFTRDIRQGDRFRVLVERLVSEEGETRYGRILAGDLVVNGSRFTAFRFAAEDGARGFYDAEGRSLRRAFLLAPVQFRRISSRMSSARRHPILGTVRRHQGIDYAADAGTPVMAAGDGVVRSRGWGGGYGNLVEIRHANGITTRYGHLRGFAKGLAVGGRVEQGEVIGYVGSTGLSTAAHLHYEFRVNGVPRNPRDADLGSGEPVPPAQRALFDAERSRLTRRMAIPRTFMATGPDAAPAASTPVAGVRE